MYIALLLSHGVLLNTRGRAPAIAVRFVRRLRYLAFLTRVHTRTPTFVIRRVRRQRYLAMFVLGRHHQSMYRMCRERKEARR